MEPQQAHSGTPPRSQYPTVRRRVYLQSSQGRTAGSTLFVGQRYKPALTFCAGPLMCPLSAAMKQDVAKLQSKSATCQGWTRGRRKRNKYPRRRKREKGNPREIFASTE